MKEDASIDLYFVGCGDFARRYHVPALDDQAHVRLKGICDPTPSAETLALAQRHGATVVENIDALPTASNLSAAICSSPHTLHVGHAMQLLDRGYHTMVDKPFVMTAEGARSLHKKANEKQLTNAVAFTRRFDRACLRAREIITAGGIGQVCFVQSIQLGYERAGWFLQPELGGGGPFTGRGAHIADLVPWLLDARPSRLRSRVRGGTKTRSDTGGFIELQFDDLECHMTCIEEGLHMWDEVRIFGDAGFIEMRRPLDVPIGWTLQWTTERGARSECLAADPHPGDATRNFFAAVRGDEPVACSFADATLSVEIIEAAFSSARDGGSWLSLNSPSAKHLSRPV